ncbi:MAG: M1 family aminopeptidase [Crocinitomicaceae bacterium]
MKHFFLGVFTLISALTIAQTGSHYCAKHKAASSLFTQDRSNTLNVSQIATTELYDVHFYKLDLNVERTTTDISGEVEIHATVLASSLNLFLFELHEDLTINSIFVNGINSTFIRNGSAVEVPVNFAQNDNVEVAVNYGGLPPNQATNPLAGGGINNGFSNSWGNQVTWTLSEPFSAYEWWPCKQSLTDKADSVYVYLTTDSINKAGSNGVLKQVIDLGNGKHRYEWESLYPINYYLISLSVAKYVDYSVYANPAGAINPVLIQNYIYDNPATLPNFQNEIDNTVDFLEHFSTLFGLYPFYEEKYGHCMAPFGGGMEHQTMTTQGWFEDGLTAHELGHQWFGDNVTCATWADIWLNEGFASYTEYLMEEQFNPGDEDAFMQNVHNNVMSQPGGSVWVEDSLNTGRIFNGRLTYDKGNAIVHTLRFLVNNDAVFFDILKAYQTQYGGGTARVEDFKIIAENLSGLDLTNYFNEWYYGEGFPTYSIKYVGTGSETIVQVSQTTSSPGKTPYFTNDLQIQLQASNGSLGTYILPITGPVSNHALPFSSTVSNIVIDPNNWIINQNGSIVEEQSILAIKASEVDVMTVYPNPTNEYIWVVLPKASPIIIFDATGKVVINENGFIGAQKIDLSNFKPGKYLVKSNGETKTFIIY